MAHNRMGLLVSALITSIVVQQVSGQILKEVPVDAVKPGDEAPPLVFEFMVQGPRPSDVSWNNLRGKLVILDFWGSWCAPCVAGIPHLNGVVSHYRGKPVQFIAVGHENPRKASWFLKKHPIDAWIALDTELVIYKSYSAWGIPYAVVVNQKGVVAAVLNPRNLTYSVIDAVLDGRVPSYPPLVAGNYWDPEIAAQYFRKVGQEGPRED